MTIPGRRIRFALAALASMLALAGPARAQEEFTLTEHDEWAATGDIDPASPEGRLATIRRAIADGEYRRAESLVDQWLDRHPQHPLTPEAYLLRGDSHVGREDYYIALFDYEFVARTYTGSEAFVTALEQEYEISRRFANGLKRKVWGMRVVDASDDAQELLIRIQERLPGSYLAEQAGMTLADLYFSRRDMTLAVEAYSLFIENYPRSDQINKARRRLIFAHLASFKGPEFDAAGLYEARSLLQQMIAIAPAAAQESGADALLVRVDESDAQKMLETARWYWKTGNPVSAEMTIRRLVRTYPRSVASADALRLVPAILEQLPPSIRDQAPEYEALGVKPKSDDGATQTTASGGASSGASK